MKTNILKTICGLLLTAPLFFGCQKEVNNQSMTVSDAETLSGEDKNKCRLTFTNYNDLYTEAYKYNLAGLVSDYEIYVLGSVYVHATMQYDKKGRLTKGKISFDNVIYQDVVFEYEKNRIVKETFFEAGTSTVVDIGLTTYNNKGQVIRREDPFYDLYTTFEYDAVGNNVINELRYLSSDYLVYRIVFDHNKHIKDPATARPGLPSYDWWYINQVTSPFEPTKRDEYTGDGVGGEFLTFDEDPSKTIINPTIQNFAANRTAFDNIFATENYQYWEYENCGCKNESASVIGKSLPKMDQRSRDIAQLKMPLLRGPGLLRQLEERRSILKRLKK